MPTPRYPRPLNLRLRCDLLNLDNAAGSTTVVDRTDCAQWLTEAGFRTAYPEPGHWILSRGGQRIHLYSPAELTAFVQRYRPNHALVALSDTTPEEIDS